MTIVEKAEEYRSDTFGTPFGGDIAMAFSEGAVWMLNEVQEWFKNQPSIQESLEQVKKKMDK